MESGDVKGVDGSGWAGEERWTVGERRADGWKGGRG